MRRVAFLALLLTGDCLAGVHEAEDDRQEQWRLAVASLQERNSPLKALATFESLTRSGWMHTSVLAQFHSIGGDLIGAEALAHAARAQDVAPPIAALDCALYESMPAIESIVDLAQNRSAIMINESHHVPLHRAFSTSLIAELRDIGFTHFGAETFVENLYDHFEDGGAPSTEMGLYSVEPIFGDLVRRAIALGFVLFSYEQKAQQQFPGQDRLLARAVREQSQAANIKKIFDTDPGARVYVHAGGAHNRKDSAGDDGIPWMAFRFKSLTGIDPLSVDLAGTPSSALKLQGPLYRAVERCGSIVEPAVLKARDGGYLARPGYDVTVFFPHVDYSMGRADWLVTMLDRRIVAIQLDPEAERTLVRAFVEGEPPNAVSMDQILVPPTVDRAILAVPVGRYRLIREWEDERTVHLGTLEISDSGK